MRLNALLELAIEKAVDEIFEGAIPLDCPTETTKRVIESIKDYLLDNE